jgi:ribonucleoside-diphosphate reductase alpha chain
MCGTGVGFSVENQFTQQFPIVKRQTGQKMPTYVVGDSKEGWANALVSGLTAWYDGYDIDFDFSKVRPAGAKLKTMGGRSSGPGALEELLSFSKNRILKKQGKRLSSLDIHDIVCETGEIVQVGGVRRSALISLSDLDDILMRDCKSGNFYERELQRRMANNSAVYETKPNDVEFMREFLSLAQSGTGERGIFNRGGLKYQLPQRRLDLGLDYLLSMGPNPCGEINIRNKGFCNLTETVARPYDNATSLIKKTRIATILGTYQAMLTDFPYLSKEWKENAEEERLLGVSITGQMDSPLTQNPEIQKLLKETAIEINKKYAKRFGINPSSAITCVKPSGTVSQLVNASPGGHTRWSPYYLRNIRISASDPLFHMIKDQKYPYYPEVGESAFSARNYVIPFAVASPEGAITRNDLTAIQQLENWKKMKVNYTEHNPSVSIYVGDNEWIDTAQWVYKNWEKIGGLSFFPKSDHVYKLAPYEEISKERYGKEISRFPNIDYSQIFLYEKDDGTSGAKEYACAGGSCEI